VASPFEKRPKAEFSRNAPQELPRLKVHLLGCRQRLATGIVLQLGDIVPGIGLRVPRDRIVIEHAYNLGHFLPPVSDWKTLGSVEMILWRRARRP
jgi:hypothetical protein